MTKAEILRSLSLDKIWKITRFEKDDVQKRLDVWLDIKKPRKLFWLFGPETAADGSYTHLKPLVGAGTGHQTWRHFNVLDYACYLHANVLTPDAFDQDHRHPSQFWGASPNAQFTKVMEHHLRNQLKQGVKPADLAKQYKLDPTEIQPLISASTSALPNKDSVVWTQVLHGQSKIDIRNLGLQMLLYNMQAEVRKAPSTAAIAVKASELQTYFAKYQKMLGYEIKQLSAL